MLVYQRVTHISRLYGGPMWIKQCHFYHPWLGMVNIPPIYGEIGNGSSLFYQHYRFINQQQNATNTTSLRLLIGISSAFTGHVPYGSVNPRNWLYIHHIPIIPHFNTKSSWDFQISYYRLVGDWPTPLKNMKVNGTDDIPFMKWKIKVMFETTNQ